MLDLGQRGPVPRTGRHDPTFERAGPPLSELEFYGCTPRPMTVAEYDEHEGRVEFFDSRTGLAWMVNEAAHFPHETPLHMLGRLLERIALMRGSPIVSGGAVEIRRTLPDGATRHVQPDQMVFLDLASFNRIATPYLNAGEDPYPDVVVEVDSTTDVRGNRLKLYEAWGFPEVWVEVPSAYALGRRPGMKSELRVYLLEGTRYARSESSRAFPGWRAEDIHRALSEPVVSEETSEILSRVGRALGERSGTGPENDPLLRERRAAGSAEAHADFVRALLGRRGVAVLPEFPSARERVLLEGTSAAAIVAAALAASSFGDFLTRLRSNDPTERR